jgi:hypothetical protein
MAEQAADEQIGEVHPEMERQGKLVAVVREEPRHGAERDDDAGPRQPGSVPAPALEGEDEAQQVEGERREPEEQHGRHVLGQVVGDREEQRRAGGREAEPERPGSRRGLALRDIADFALGTPGRSGYRSRPGDEGAEANPAKVRDQSRTCLCAVKVGSTTSG